MEIPCQNSDFQFLLRPCPNKSLLKKFIRYDLRNRVVLRAARGVRRAGQARDLVFRVSTRVSPRVAM